MFPQEKCLFQGASCAVPKVWHLGLHSPFVLVCTVSCVFFFAVNGRHRLFFFQCSDFVLKLARPDREKNYARTIFFFAHEVHFSLRAGSGALHLRINSQVGLPYTFNLRHRPLSSPSAPGRPCLRLPHTELRGPDAAPQQLRPAARPHGRPQPRLPARDPPVRPAPQPTLPGPGRPGPGGRLPPVLPAAPAAAAAAPAPPEPPPCAHGASGDDPGPVPPVHGPHEQAPGRPAARPAPAPARPAPAPRARDRGGRRRARGGGARRTPPGAGLEAAEVQRDPHQPPLLRRRRADPEPRAPLPGPRQERGPRQSGEGPRRRGRGAGAAAGHGGGAAAVGCTYASGRASSLFTAQNLCHHRPPPAPPTTTTQLFTVAVVVGRGAGAVLQPTPPSTPLDLNTKRSFFLFMRRVAVLMGDSVVSGCCRLFHHLRKDKLFCVLDVHRAGVP